MAPDWKPAALEAILRHLDEAKRPILPAPPRLRLLLLLAAVGAFRVFTTLLLPVFCFAVIALPVIYRFATGERAPGLVGGICWAAALWIGVAWWRALRRRAPVSDDSIVLAPERYPLLHELVERIARVTGAPTVSEIRIGPGSAFCVGRRVGCHTRACAGMQEMGANRPRNRPHT